MVGMNHFNKKTAHFLGGTFLIGYMQYGGVWGGGGGVGSRVAFVCIKSEMVVIKLNADIAKKTAAKGWQCCRSFICNYQRLTYHLPTFYMQYVQHEYS